jgi:hypothetical protein
MGNLLSETPYGPEQRPTYVCCREMENWLIVPDNIPFDQPCAKDSIIASDGWKKIMDTWLWIRYFPPDWSTFITQTVLSRVDRYRAYGPRTASTGRPCSRSVLPPELSLPGQWSISAQIGSRPSELARAQRSLAAMV